MEKTGEAYGFFYYQGNKGEILRELPKARTLAKTPPELKLDLVKGVGNLDTKGDSELVNIVQEAKSQHMNYVLKATLPYTGNSKTASELGDILNNLYNSELYNGKEPFYAGIVHKRGEQYIFKRN